MTAVGIFGNYTQKLCLSSKQNLKKKESKKASLGRETEAETKRAPRRPRPLALPPITAGTALAPQSPGQLAASERPPGGGAASGGRGARFHRSRGRLLASPGALPSALRSSLPVSGAPGLLAPRSLPSLAGLPLFPLHSPLPKPASRAGRISEDLPALQVAAAADDVTAAGSERERR